MIKTTKSLVYATCILSATCLVRAGGGQSPDHLTLTVKTVTSSDDNQRSPRDNTHRQIRTANPIHEEVPTTPHDDLERLAKEWHSFCENPETDNPELEVWCARSLRTTLNWLMHLSQDTSEPPTPDEIQDDHHPTIEELEELEELRLALPLEEIRSPNRAKSHSFKNAWQFICSCPCCDNSE